MHADLVVVGGGITGLAAARLLDVDACLFERDARVGGCLRSDHVGGYTIDRTGHLLHFQDEYVRRVMFDELSLDWLHFERRAEIRMLERRVDYPVQYNLHQLPKAERDWCLQSYLAVSGEAPALEDSFEQWSRRSYGEGLHELFMGPYNCKLWQVPLDTISAEWASRFVPMPDRQKIVDGTRGPHRDNAFGYNASFSYPRDGGSGAIADALASQVSIPIHTGAELTAIDPIARVCEFSNGARVHYDLVLNTMPLPQLLGCIHKADPEVRALADGLRHNSVFYLAFGFRVSSYAPDAHWIYVPEERYAMYRIGILSNYSSSVAPAGSILVCAEIGCAPHEVANVDPDEIARRVLDDFDRIGLLQPDWEVDLVHSGSINCAYVIFDEHRRKALPRIQSYLKKLGILSVGRFGGWGYGSMGDALIEGRDSAALIKRQFGHSMEAQVSTVRESAPHCC